MGGVVSYANEAKSRMLGVDIDVLGQYGAVSEPVVRAMAAGALQHLGGDLSVAVSGIAGPDGGTPEKPVGTVWFAWGRREGEAIQVDVAVEHERARTLLEDARPVLLDLGGAGGFDLSPWAERVRMVDARHDGVWELPVLGEIPAPPAVLIRPDGHVAWTGDLALVGLEGALRGCPVPAMRPERLSQTRRQRFAI
jgi:PncC family amidohydrolase